jgi:hypothetical protein
MWGIMCHVARRADVPECAWTGARSAAFITARVQLHAAAACGCSSLTSAESTVAMVGLYEMADLNLL